VGSRADYLHCLERQAKVFSEALYPVDCFVGSLGRCGQLEYWQEVIEVMAKDGWEMSLDYPVEGLHKQVKYVGLRLAAEH